jgi:hypothetical protein
VALDWNRRFQAILKDLRAYVRGVVVIVFVLHCAHAMTRVTVRPTWPIACAARARCRRSSLTSSTSPRRTPRSSFPRVRVRVRVARRDVVRAVCACAAQCTCPTSARPFARRMLAAWLVETSAIARACVCVCVCVCAADVVRTRRDRYIVHGILFKFANNKNDLYPDEEAASKGAA